MLSLAYKIWTLVQARISINLLSLYVISIFYQVNWQTDVINVLLNNGANVNQLNDEGCSALSAGTIFFYPVEGFR